MARLKGSVDTKPRKPRSDAGVPRVAKPGDEGYTPAPKKSNLTDEYRQALLISRLPAIERLDEQLSELAQERKDLVNHIKNAGAFKAWEIKHALDLRADMKNTGGDAETDRARKRHQLAEWLNHPSVMQGDFFATPQPDRQPLADRAEKEGFICGLEGGQCKPPYDEVESHKRWIAGWHDGQERLLAEGLKQLSGEDSLIPANRPDAEPVQSKAKDPYEGADGELPDAEDEPTAEEPKEEAPKAGRRSARRSEPEVRNRFAAQGDEFIESAKKATKARAKAE